VSSTGYPSTTVFALHVGTPNCLTDLGGGSVNNNFPYCSNALTALESGDSTDEATVTPH
jgi:hypothetical protein